MRERGATRVYAAEPLGAGAELELAPGPAHHLRAVLRLAPGAGVAAFNATDGEWLCHIAEIGRNRLVLTVERLLRPAAAEPDLWLVFAPIKRARLDWLVEKATELGVSALLPVWTQRTQIERLNLERLQAHAVAAAEQSERLSVPELRSPQAARPRSRGLAARAEAYRLRRDRQGGADRRCRGGARPRSDRALDRPRRRLRRDGA